MFSWKSKDQTVVALISKGDEYIALAMGIKGALWIMNFCQVYEMVMPVADFKKLFYVTIRKDNQA